MVKLTKIYTKTGDKGTSSLCTGERFDKYNEYFQAIGDVDELNAHMGMIYAHTEDLKIREMICRIQNDLFDIGADLSAPLKYENALRLRNNQHIFLEELVDLMNVQLPHLDSFVMPRGSVLVSQIHIARTVCRRAERTIVYLNSKYLINPEVMIYINRLSDLLFVLARFVTTLEETLWKPGLYQQG